MTRKCAVRRGVRPKTSTARREVGGIHEQWVYGMNSYLYFENGTLASIQNDMRKPPDDRIVRRLSHTAVKKRHVLSARSVEAAANALAQNLQPAPRNPQPAKQIRPGKTGRCGTQSSVPGPARKPRLRFPVSASNGGCASFRATDAHAVPGRRGAASGGTCRAGPRIRCRAAQPQNHTAMPRSMNSMA